MNDPAASVSVLMVDDEPANLLALEAILQPLGRRLVRANSGAEALRHVLTEDFAVILLDVRMPDMNGFEAAELIRSRSRSQSTPIIFLTGVETSSEMMFEGYSTGAVDYLLKPIVPTMLRSKVEVFIELAAVRLLLQNELQERRKAADALAELNGKLRRSNDELARSNAELDSFCATVSHDLRTPLGHVSGFVQALRESAAAKLDDGECRYLDIVQQATVRMADLIGDFLRFARLGHDALRSTRVDMDAIVRGAVDELLTDRPRQPVQWAIDALPSAMADARMVRQVWLNLVSNALKYSRTRECACIRIRGQSQGDEVVYSVADNGVGFDPDQAKRLFTAFTRLHAKYEGIGIGLASVKRIVQRHGGRVWAEAELDGGATFFFTLPAVASIDRHKGKLADSVNASS